MTFGSRPPLALTLPALAGALMLLAQPAGAQTDAPKACLLYTSDAADE